MYLESDSLVLPDEPWISLGQVALRAPPPGAVVKKKRGIKKVMKRVKKVIKERIRPIVGAAVAAIPIVGSALAPIMARKPKVRGMEDEPDEPVPVPTSVPPPPGALPAPREKDGIPVIPILVAAGVLVLVLARR